MMMNCVFLFRKSFVYFDEEGKKGCISRITERALKEGGFAAALSSLRPLVKTP